ncbi:MAG TPA: hypothetical protein VHJ38_08775, partial [Nitrososphaeraceae archaeon]|nr:hypothetical protein [Nitrososphaeraceae archaeon]
TWSIKALVQVFNPSSICAGEIGGGIPVRFDIHSASVNSEQNVLIIGNRICFPSGIVHSLSAEDKLPVVPAKYQTYTL